MTHLQTTSNHSLILNQTRVACVLKTNVNKRSDRSSNLKVTGRLQAISQEALYQGNLGSAYVFSSL